MKGLSVVIPCYNSRNTIIKCLRSLENNVLDTEVIIVEDCSEEISEDLIREYAKDSKLSIRYIRNEENLGAGQTRNRGIKSANKEYITFLDSDDEFDKDYFYYVSGPIEKEYDEIIYDAKRIYSDCEKHLGMFFSDNLKEGQIDQREALVYIRGCSCGKIYRTALIRENDVMFAELPRNEDMVFTKVATSFMRKIYYLQKELYLYINSTSSLMNNQSLITTQNAIRAYQMVRERLNGRNFDKELNSMLFIEVLYSTTNTLTALQEKRKTIKRNYSQYRKGYKARDQYRKGYSIVYRLSYAFFKLHLFKTYGIIRAYISGR